MPHTGAGLIGYPSGRGPLRPGPLFPIPLLQWPDLHETSLPLHTPLHSLSGVPLSIRERVGSGRVWAVATSSPLGVGRSGPPLAQGSQVGWLSGPELGLERPRPLWVFWYSLDVVCVPRARQQVEWLVAPYLS